MPTEFTLRVDGREVAASEGTTIAAAIGAAGTHACRKSVSGEARGPLCAMGICFECRVTVNGVAHVRSCQVMAEAGMEVRTGESSQEPSGAGLQPVADEARHRFDVLILGGGPAGLAAASEAASSGQSVGLVDDNPAFGGQIWRAAEGLPMKSAMSRWYGVLRRDNVRPLRGVRVFEQSAPGVLAAESTTGQVLELNYRELILCTGARERFLPFPGWTLPNVMGAGGLQAMAKSGLSLAGKRVLVAGTGPLLLAVAAYLKDHRARVVAIAEQAPAARVRQFAKTIATHFPGKILQAARLRAGLLGVPYRQDTWPLRALGDGQLRAVVLCGSREEEIACDYLACGFGLVPNSELGVLLGCELQNGFVRVDDNQRTSVEHVYCAGEPTGIGGLELSLVEGQIAGLIATGQTSKAQQLFPRRASYTRFAQLLESTFALRDELKQLASDDTLVCRCEDVSFARARQYSTWRAAKLQTRCGMGPCQGRVCGPAMEFMLGWRPESVRPPVFPARLGSLAQAAQQEVHS